MTPSRTLLGHPALDELRRRPPARPQAALADGRRLARPADHQRRERARDPPDRAEARRARRRQPLAGTRGACESWQARGSSRSRRASARQSPDVGVRDARELYDVPPAARAALREHAVEALSRAASPSSTPCGRRWSERSRRRSSGSSPRTSAYFRTLLGHCPNATAARARRADLEQGGQRYWSVFARLPHYSAGSLVQHAALHEAVRARRPSGRRGREPGHPRACAAGDRRDLRAGAWRGSRSEHPVDYVVVGAGAIGGTVGARLVRVPATTCSSATPTPTTSRRSTRAA